MADLEAHAQLVGAVVEQEDGEDAVGDDGADQLGGAAEQGLQVERGVERVGNLGEVAKVGGLDARIRGVNVRVWIFGVGGPVVAFELGVGARDGRGGGHGGTEVDDTRGGHGS